MTDKWINVFFDFETFWGVKYSLRTQNMSYTDYVLDEKFQIHGCSFIFNDGPAEFQTADQTEDMFSWMIDMQESGYKFRLIAHNMLFDGIIARLVFDFIADEYFCTLAMVDAEYQHAIGSGLDSCMTTLLKWESGKADIITKIKDMRTEDIPPELWEELVEYADDDVKACKQLYDIYAELLPTEEHKIMDIVIKMFCRPLLQFNEEVLLEAVKEADIDRENRVAKALVIVGGEREAAITLLKGTKTFPNFLTSLGYTVPMKLNPKGVLIPALAKTDVGFIAMQESDDEQLKALVEGRLAVKSTQATTRSYRFKKLHELIGLFPAAYNYARAHTWRVTGGNKINAANLKRGSKLRTCIEAPEGHVLAVADASQIECRTNLYVAGQNDGLQVFRDKRDPYNEMARDIFGREIDRKGNPDDFFEGFLGKTATLGLGFQMGAKAFKATVERDAKQHLNMDIDFELGEAYRIVDLYRRKNWKVEKQWGKCEEFLYCMIADKTMTHKFADGELLIDGPNNKIWFPNGTWLYYPGLDCDNGNFTYLNARGKGFIQKYIYGGLLDENIVQKFARDITSHHMVQIAERYPVVMHTYDENIAVVPDAEAEEATEWMIDLMSKPPEWAASIPLAAEGGFAREYSK